jgi:hypothetical protein
MRRYRALVIALVVVGCDVHRLLEAPPPPYVRLSLALAPASLTVSRGGELTFTATVTRTGEDHGPVTVSLDTPPVGITAETQSSSTSGDVTTATIVVKAATDAPVGDYSVTVRGRANEATDGTSVLILHVISPPAYSLTLSKQSLTIARGGIDRIGLALERTNLSSPITLSVTGQAGISGTFDPNPLTNDSTNATIAVGVDIAPGTYNVSLRGSVAGVPDRTAPLTVNVVADALQVITPSSLSSPQLSTAATEIIVNAAAASGVSLSAEGLPSGVTASFDPLSSGNQATKLRLDVAGTAPAGTYTVTVRAKASGVSDATSTLAFNILPATIGLAATPKAANLFAGNSVIASLAVSRSNFSGSVALSADALPSGITATFDSATIKGGSAAATITAAPTVAPGTYAVNLRATPAGLAADAAQSAAVAITVVPPPTTGANVVLDWSKCAAPDWLAVQDGAGPWTRVSGSGGIFSGAVSSAVGGIAWVENGTTTVVRYMTHAELVSRPLDMCGLSSGPRSLSGSATHGSPTEQGTYSLGGGTGLSSGTQPRFTITGARDGVHDLLAYTTFQGSAPTRVILRRGHGHDRSGQFPGFRGVRPGHIVARNHGQRNHGRGRNVLELDDVPHHSRVHGQFSLRCSRHGADRSRFAQFLTLDDWLPGRGTAAERLLSGHRAVDQQRRVPFVEHCVPRSRVAIAHDGSARSSADGHVARRRIQATAGNVRRFARGVQSDRHASVHRRTQVDDGQRHSGIWRGGRLVARYARSEPDHGMADLGVDFDVGIGAMAVHDGRQHVVGIVLRREPCQLSGRADGHLLTAGSLR